MKISKGYAGGINEKNIDGICKLIVKNIWLIQNKSCIFTETNETHMKSL